MNARGLLQKARARAAGLLGFALATAVWTACQDDASDADASTPYDGGVQSLPNGALEFDGELDYASTGTAGFPSSSSPQTISLWVQYAAAANTQIFVSLRTDFASGVNVGIRDGQLAAWTVYAGALLVATTKLPSVGTWHHVAFVLNGPAEGGTVHTVYVDGVASATGTGSPDRLTPLSSWLGSLDGLMTSDFFMGDMDEIRIWSVAQQASDVALDMNGESSPTAPGLEAYFNCNAIYGTRVRDNSGNGNDATLGGGDPTRMPTLVASDVPP